MSTNDQLEGQPEINKFLESKRILFNMIRDGKAGTYAKLRSLASAILYREEQTSFLPPPDPRQAEVKSKYDRVLDSVLRLISGSFSPEELSIRSVLDSNLAANIEKIDLIMGYLQKIKNPDAGREHPQNRHPGRGDHHLSRFFTPILDRDSFAPLSPCSFPCISNSFSIKAELR